MKTSTKHFVIAAFLFSAFALSGHLTTAEGSWKLRKIIGHNDMDGNYGTITAERYDASGGSVDIKISGDAAGVCPGGFETVRFVWNFAGDINGVVNGGGVSASLAAGQSAKSQNCGSGLSADSYMEMRGSSGSGSGKYLPSGVLPLLDGERFLTVSNPRVRGAKPYAQSGTGTVKVNTHNLNPNKPWAYFEVMLSTPTKYGGGSVYYFYLYENTGGGVTQNDTTNAPTPTASGSWSGSWRNSKGESGATTINIREGTGGKITGDEDGWTIENGRRVGNALTWEYRNMNNGCRDYKVRFEIAGDRTMRGEYQVYDKCEHTSYSGSYIKYVRQ